VNQLNAALGDARAVLGDVRTTLKGADGVLEEVLAVTKNTRAATTDLGVMRAQVEANLRKVEHLLNEINRKWPFARDTELKLP
jgi:phospholipid/cholesterol/gamma-HCH transport system substrate-binding protein